MSNDQRISMTAPIGRRRFLTAVCAVSATALAAPALVRAQAREVKVGYILPVTGPLAFEAQLALAAEAKKPAVIHARDADEDVAAILAGHPDVPVILHSFSSGMALLRAGLVLRHYVSFSGMVTFKNWRLDDAILETPIDRLLLETDGPYLAPVPHRGQRNEPGFVRHVAERIALVRGMTGGELIHLTGQNALRVFQL